MDRKTILKNSIAIIGPKQVGKTFVAEELKKQENTPNFVLSSDLLTNLIVYELSGRWRDIVVGSEIEQIASVYKSKFKFSELSPLVENMAKCHQHPRLNEKSKKVAISYWKARLLEDATDMLKEPYILDAGADVGAVINLSSDEALEVSQCFYLPYDFIKDRMSSFLNSFGVVSYMKPGKEYHLLDGRAQDAENAIYLESGMSYTPYANHTIDCKKLYETQKPKEETIKPVLKEINSLFAPQTFGE